VGETTVSRWETEAQIQQGAVDSDFQTSAVGVADS